MQRAKPENLDQKRHADVARDTMEDIKELGPTAGYRAANRDRALGEADRTGRHFDESTDAPEDHEAEAPPEDHEAEAPKEHEGD